MNVLGRGPVTRYDHLEAEAISDFERILQESLTFGPDVSGRTNHRFLAHFDRIAGGVALGHRRCDIPTRTPVAFVRVRAAHDLIAYNPETRRVFRVLDGRRDLPRLLS